MTNNTTSNFFMSFNSMVSCASLRNNPFEDPTLLRVGRIASWTFPKEVRAKATAKSGYRYRSEARASLFEYIENFYDRRRRHSALGCGAPAEYEAQYQKAQASRVKPSTEMDQLQSANSSEA